jgi:hypothetical protein
MTNEPEPERRDWQLWMPSMFVLYMLLHEPQNALYALAWIGVGYFVLEIKGVRIYHFGMPEYMVGIRAHILKTYYMAWWPWFLFR